MILNLEHSWELHCHSQFSDGQLSCQDLYQQAVTNGVRNLALTDHDTAVGYRESVKQGWIPEEMKLYPAAELSCVWRGRTLHVVGLGMDVYSDEWLSVEARYEARREKRFQRIIYLLNKAKFDIDEARIRELAHQGMPARPHIARFLVETKQVKDSAQAFKRWLGQGKLGDVKSQWPELAEAVQSITDNKGIAVLAHPHRYKLTWTKARELLDDYQAVGGQAIEIACVGMHPEMRSFLTKQAIERGMMGSGGSDFHSPNTQWLKLGKFPTWPKDLPLVTDWLDEQYQLRIGEQQIHEHSTVIKSR